MVRPLGAAVTSMILVAVLAACSGGEAGNGATTDASSVAAEYAKTPPMKIFGQSMTAMADLSRYHFEGDYGDLGTVGLDVTRTGECDGTISGANDGAIADVRIVLDQVYLRGTSDYWATRPDVEAADIDRLADQWVTGVPGLDDQLEMCYLVSLAPFTLADPPTEVASISQVGDVPTVVVEVTEPYSTPAVVTLNIAATSPHYVLSAEVDGETSLFSDFNSDVIIHVPPSSVPFA